MKIGFAVPALGDVAPAVGRVAEFAREAERAGAASLWVGDRNFAAVNPKVGAGGRGNTIPVEYWTAADPFVALAVAAAATERVRLGTHVLIAPLYPPVQLARSLTTLDLVSGGRLIPGFGVGWSPEEYEAAGLDFHQRGARLDELLDVLDLLWTENPVEYHGKHLELPLQHAPLKPAQQPHPPIHLGGSAPASLERIGRRASGWLPLAMVPVFVNVDLLLAERAAIDTAARAAGRDPAEIDTVLRVNVVAGTPTTQVVDTIHTVADRTGIDHFLIDSMSLPTVDATLDLVTEVMKLVNQG
ncbi:TIGR03619 family F420-dependent LLM class oxidoreductase [Kribbella sp. NPDC051770]|uniref:TIGR03619 family F420-dependent LLM class oxidoreductase n=1 Tax=Kribbella sp. NPDC051770 TaxID=3155413 RepID=UPI00341E07DD